jgi:hypothetical protein
MTENSLLQAAYCPQPPSRPKPYVRAMGSQPNPENATLEELSVAMEAAPNKRSYVRLNAIRSLLMVKAMGSHLKGVLPK